MNRLTPRPVFRPWGSFITIYQAPGYWTKIISVDPGEYLSLQYHQNRAEFWYPLDEGLRGVIGDDTIDLVPGTRYDVMKNAVHRISNVSLHSARLIEVATGNPTEDDIIRIHDKYGR